MQITTSPHFQPGRTLGQKPTEGTPQGPTPTPETPAPPTDQAPDPQPPNNEKKDDELSLKEFKQLCDNSIFFIIEAVISRFCVFSKMC